MLIEEFYQRIIKDGFTFSTDSRHIGDGDIFFALKGENFNGNSYALSALEKGASIAVVDEDQGNDQRLVKVENVLLFFQELAAFHRKCFDIPVIAVGGSNGKTTTKNLIHAVVSQQFKTHVTKGNFNNHIGVPITLLEMPRDCEVAIIEVGTNHPGEIAELCNIVQPNYGLITNIGKEHLEGFGTIEAVAKEESEVYLHLHKNDGHAFVNADDEWLMRMARSLEKTTFTKNDLEIISLVPSIEFTYKKILFKSQLMGDYNLDNILTAITIGEHLEMDLQIIAKGISAYTADNNRSEILRNGTNTIWLDAYNANPSSMEVAIKNFAKMQEENKVLILGDMFEMGEAADSEHAALVNNAKKFNFTKIFLLGEHFSKVENLHEVPVHQDMDSLCEELSSANFQDTAFLIKGSRGMKMERVLPALGIAK